MKKFDFLNCFDKAAEMLIRLLPDWVTGKSDVMKQKYCLKYGAGDYSGPIRRNKAKVMTSYMLIMAFFLTYAAGACMGKLTERGEIESIQKPSFSEAEKSVPVEAHVKYKDYELIRALTIKVKQKELDETEKLRMLNNYKIKLEKLILGENADINHINKPLNLVERDMETGITVNWDSDHPDLISGKGEVDLIGARDNQTVMLQAELTLDDVSIAQAYPLKLDTDAAEEDYKRSMAGRLNEIVARIAETDELPDVDLPAELGGGVSVRWYAGERVSVSFLPLILLFAFLIIYFKRYDSINREIRKAEESIIRDLPEFINKLVLLLNAGLVISTAFSKIAGDYEQLYHSGKPEKLRKQSYLYEELLGIQKRINRSNASLIRELKEFSQRCGVREMVRITAVISDNWNKGSMLAEKLEGEGELLWISRKKRAEEKGRLAETKLTFPLMILLIVLIMITTAPAMLEM